MKRHLSGIVVVLMAMAALGGLPAPSAHAASKSATKCVTNNGMMDTTCITVSKPVFHSKRLDSMPVINKSKIKVKASCGWSDTVSVRLTVGAKVGASAEASIVGLGKVAAKVELSTSLSMSGATARSLAGSFTLKPGQKLVCHRIFGYYTFSVNVKRTLYGKATTTKTTAKVPYSLGALFDTK